MPVEPLSGDQILSPAVRGQLEKVMAEKTVLGRPVTVGEISLIPIVSCSLGFGSGVWWAENHGAAGGAKITPAAILVLKDGTVTVIHLEVNRASVLPVEPDN